MTTGVAKGVRAAPGENCFLKFTWKFRLYNFMCLRAIKTKALQLQRVPILSILGYNIDLYFKQALQFPKPKTKGRQIWPPPERPKVLLCHCLWLLQQDLFRHFLSSAKQYKLRQAYMTTTYMSEGYVSLHTHIHTRFLTYVLICSADFSAEIFTFM